MNAIRILLADDHEVVRMGIGQVLATVGEFEVAGEVSNGNALLACLRATPCDVVVTDLAMPGISGLDLIRRIRIERGDVQVLVHSMYADGQMAVRALKAGASGYVTKGSDASALIDGIRSVAGGRRFISGDLADEVLSILVCNGGGEPHDRLSDREFEVFRMFVGGQAVGDIAAALSLSPKTVSTHKIRLMHKLGVRTDGELLRYATANGLSA